MVIIASPSILLETLALVIRLFPRKIAILLPIFLSVISPNICLHSSLKTRLTINWPVVSYLEGKVLISCFSLSTLPFFPRAGLNSRGSLSTKTILMSMELVSDSDLPSKLSMDTKPTPLLHLSFTHDIFPINFAFPSVTVSIGKSALRSDSMSSSLLRRACISEVLKEKTFS